MSRRDELFKVQCKPRVEIRVKFDEELTFDPCLEFRVQTRFPDCTWCSSAKRELCHISQISLYDSLI